MIYSLVTGRVIKYPKEKNTVIDLIKELPGNDSVNTSQHATI
jgi:hypothetical protein